LQRGRMSNGGGKKVLKSARLYTLRGERGGESLSSHFRSISRRDLSRHAWTKEEKRKRKKTGGSLEPEKGKIKDV